AQGMDWIRSEAPVTSNVPFTIIFEAEELSVNSSSLSVDDFSLSNGACSTHGNCCHVRKCQVTNSCNFEEDYCLWTNLGGETDTQNVLAYYWKRYQGLQRTASFAPVIDHTTQTVHGYYMLVESSLADTGSLARLY
ncbi:unnamed protein product, partial [Candidula unifasciata]